MFSRDEAGAPRTGLAPLAVPAAAVAIALLAGCITAMVGALAGYRAIYYVAVPGALAIGAGITLTRTEPLRFAYLALLALLPFTALVVPPGRLGLTVFDVAISMLACALLLDKAFAPRGAQPPLFPAPSLLLIWVLLLPCVVFARHPPRAIEQLGLMFAAYGFFWLTLLELQRPRGFERLAGLLSVAVIVLSAGVFVDATLHLNLTPGGGNLNQRTVNRGVEVWRAGGFFQDGQKAGAFLAASLAFLLVLSVRQRFEGRLRLLAWTAILAGIPALLFTVSRSAILSFLLVSTVALVAINRWSAVTKLAICSVLLPVAVFATMMPGELTGLLPAGLANRLADSGDDLQSRVDVWLDTWDMFAKQPLTGIGPGGFQQYLLDTRPGQFDYYGIGAATGVTYVPDQPESGWFKILYETGILGSAAVLLLAGATLRRAASGIVRAADAAARTETVAALAGITTFLVTFTTLFMTGDPRILALLLILLAVIWRSSLAPAPAAGSG
jgi:O-antigen ligase